MFCQGNQQTFYFTVLYNLSSILRHVLMLLRSFSLVVPRLGMAQRSGAKYIESGARKKLRDFSNTELLLICGILCIITLLIESIKSSLVTSKYAVQMS
jgi:hypothetical protein